jgi:hypothetical protein
VPPFIIAGMGYSSRYFWGKVRPWVEKGWLPPGGKLIDFGSQQFGNDSERTRADVFALLKWMGHSEEVPELTVPAVFHAAGFEYVSIDVDGQRGSQYFDLNCFAVPSEYLGHFDFVNNEGTIEHLVNPINGFHAAHDFAKVDGVIRHSMPLMGWKDHGFLYPTPKFYAHLIGANCYQTLVSRMSVQQVSESFDDPLIRKIINQTGGQRLTYTDAWIELIYRKTADKPFEIPVDHLHHLPAETADKIAQDLKEYYRQLAHHRRVP